MKVVLGIVIFIFLFPVCLVAGLFGGCLAAGLTGMIDDSGTLAVVSMAAGALIGVGSAIALTILAVRSMRSSHPH